MVDKHRPLFASHLASIVCGRDRRLEELRNARQRLSMSRSETDTQLRQAKSSLEAVSASLHQAGRGRVELGDFNRLSPIGAPADDGLHRHFIEQFLETHASDIRGRVLEIPDHGYALRFGGARVTLPIGIDFKETSPPSTVLEALRARHVTPRSCDCVILAHTLHVAYDVRALLQEAAGAAAPGGVVLATLPCTSSIKPERPHGDFWRFTAAAARRLFGEFFPADGLDVASYGNVLIDIASLYGLERDDLSPEECQTHDPFFPLLIGVRARA